MKLLFGIDLTNPENKAMDGEPFITRRLSGPLEDEFEKLNGEVDQIEKEIRLPRFLRGVRYVAGMCVIVIPCVLLESCGEQKGRNRTTQNATLLFLGIAAGMLAIWLFLTWLEIHRARRKQETPEVQSTESRAKAFLEASEKELGIPDRTVKMDVLCSRYHWSNGKMLDADNGSAWHYGNIEFSAWREKDRLCLAERTTRFDIPLNTFRRAEKIKRGYFISSWNKAEHYRSAEYRKYKIHTVNGEICPNGYIAVCLEYRGEDYEMRVPLWEVDSLSDLTGWMIVTE